MEFYNAECEERGMITDSDVGQRREETSRLRRRLGEGDMYSTEIRGEGGKIRSVKRVTRPFYRKQTKINDTLLLGYWTIKCTGLSNGGEYKMCVRLRGKCDEV